eukprot:NODE_823_length_1168_cov_117.807877_g781_i0.p1 GENE.NODE_823_length_1168_cov_117.807877_g781_i0~~NODE_823_length_1168_cov_117.807877_g781_i0.p1  ORF type:complete len:309 (-),score=64.96 NODE_823_length_1168_cov_117.807877_g781_i0:136-1062(-)
MLADPYAVPPPMGYGEPAPPVYGAEPPPVYVDGPYGAPPPVEYGAPPPAPVYAEPTYAPEPGLGLHHPMDDARSEVSDAWTLALSEITYRPGHEVPLNLMEELMLLKAGDKPKFPRNNPTLDRIMAAALLLELVAEQKVAIDGEYAVNPRRLALRVADDSPTGSNIANSALKAMKKRKATKHMTTGVVIDSIAKAGGGLSQRILWRLVKKQKVVYDPRTMGADKYPIVGGQRDLQNLRERVVRIMDRTYDEPNVRDMMLAFLYYLPKNAADKIFMSGDMPYSGMDELYVITKSIAFAVADYKTNHKWI